VCGEVAVDLSRVVTSPHEREVWFLDTALAHRVTGSSFGLLTSYDADEHVVRLVQSVASTFLVSGMEAVAGGQARARLLARAAVVRGLTTERVSAL
jgi:hypothetical protein